MSAVDECDKLKECLARTRIHIDDANDWSGQLLASDVELDAEPTAQIKSVNDRFVIKIFIRLSIVNPLIYCIP